MDKILARLEERFPGGATTRQRPDLAFVTIEAAWLREAALHLRDREGFTHLVLLTAVDWLEAGQFQLTYLLNNRALACDIGLRVMLRREAASMESIHDLWPTAATYQRELREMFGIDFPGSPRVDAEFILEGWIGPPPYRRDFDTLAFAETNFRHREGRETRDPAAYMKHKLYPEKG
ncbi:NADH-quinone oxidoreductase subunit C [Phaeovulum sp.]|uniref:NADH-quinone oxidoreductase subunit C n=1 Tax=Phaeovulum sp. TaxID=2934796 RepID=UPI00356B1689